MVSLLAPFFFFSLSFSTLTQCGEPYKDIEKLHLVKRKKTQTPKRGFVQNEMARSEQSRGYRGCITGQLISLFNSVIYTRRFVEDTAA